MKQRLSSITGYLGLGFYIASRLVLPATLPAYYQTACLRKVILLSVVALSTSQTIGQEVHVVQGTNSSFVRSKSTESAPNQHGNMFRVNVDLVLVPVTVTDSSGRLVTGLDKDNFRIYEGKEEQAIKHFSNEDAPVSVGILLDTSGSMKGKIERARDAVMELLQTANPQDEFFMIRFSDTPELVTDFTNSIEEIQTQLLYGKPNGSTALLDAIYLGISKMRQAHNPRKALLVISDGGDNHSRYHEREIKSAVREADTLMYAVGIYDQFFPTMEEQLGPALLGELSEETGGRMFTVDNPKDLPDVATKISLELRNQYVLGYRPMDPKHDSKWHRIKVKLLLPKGVPRLEARAKKGYYAQSE